MFADPRKERVYLLLYKKFQKLLVERNVAEVIIPNTLNGGKSLMT